ncbi:MAG: histidine kinase [Lachnospiraceae bacterium]|jgi:two-component system sensor histidine kinase YesM|nr:histidine kinase [Lachnospiraceae bacterium]
MLARLSEKTKNLPLAKEILSILLTAIMLFSFFLFIGYTVIIHANNNLLYRTSSKLLSYASKDITRNLNAIEEMGNDILKDSAIQSSLSQCHDAEDSIIPPNAYSEIYSSINTYYQKYKTHYVDYVQIVSDHVTAMAPDPDSQVIPAKIQKELIGLAMEQDGRLSWVTDYNDTYGVFLVRELKRIKNLSLDTIGVLIINVNLTKLQDNISNMNTISPASYALYSGNKTIYLPQELDGLQKQDLSSIPFQSYAVKHVKDLRYLIVRGRIDTTGWDYYCLAPYDDLYHNMKLVQRLFLLVIIINILLSIAMTKIMMKPLMIHFEFLTHKIQAFGNDNLELIDVPYSYQNRHDEIGLIHQQFDAMADKIRILIRENYDSKLLAKEAQLKALEMQINPHFLYNTLQTINWRAKMLHDEQISVMTESLGKLLRITLSDSNEDSSLGQELELVQYYINIQKLRFDEELFYETDVPEYLLYCYLPKFILQPLAENAIRYGLEDESEDCHIRIRAAESNKQLTITVENTGSVFEEDLLQKLMAKEIIPHGFGIGLLNVNSRLAFAFGDDYSMEFSNQNEYATVNITLPFQIKS